MGDDIAVIVAVGFFSVVACAVTAFGAWAWANAIAAAHRARAFSVEADTRVERATVDEDGKIDLHEEPPLGAMRSAPGRLPDDAELLELNRQAGFDDTETNERQYEAEERRPIDRSGIYGPERDEAE